MKKVGVVLDEYKLPVFKRILDAAGYSYTEQKGPVKKTILLQVQCDFIGNLKPFIEQAERESKK
jgi:hypothetical protein